VVAFDSLKNKGHFLPSIKSMDLNGELAPSCERLPSNPIMDNTFGGIAHDETDDNAVLTILQVIDENGNEIKDEEEEVSGSLNDENNEEVNKSNESFSETVENTEKSNNSQYYQFDENKTKTQRQKDNNAVFDLLDKADKGELTPENITPAQKATLAKYSGSGGGLKSRDGKTGSPHEYYTPAPIAQAMWQAVEEMGFNGGKVLDPCAGSGIFGAYAPKNTVIQAIEMDETSAQVNRLVNGGDNYHVQTASFEEMAKNIPDNSVDAIVTNVPFGDVSLRKHRNKDGKFQKENLQTYFVLRSLDKLRYGGLACFIVPASFLDNKGGKAKNARVLTSQIAEFIGAYRLPNSVFGTASADVATDVIFYRKYKKETIEKIEELQAQNPDVLAQAKVMWDKYIDGQYFRLPENKKFIFGEETEIESWRTDANGDKKKVYAVINNDSVANIAKAIKKFKGSRIDWALLEETETGPLIYNAGDVIHQNGQAYVFDGLTFNAVEQSESETESFANDVLSKLENPLMAFEENVSAKNALAMYAHLINTAQYGIIPSWIMPLLTNIELVDENKREQQFKRVLTGLSVQYVLDNFDSSDNTVEYPELSEEMKKNIVLDKKLNVFKKANDAIKLHWNKKTGFSNVWKGIQSEIKQELSDEKKIEQFQYLNGTLELPIEKLQSLNINPLESDDWCINANGTTAMKADDYFVGNVAECLAKIDADIQAAKTPEIKAKLEKMREQAKQRTPDIDVSSMAFSMRSPFVDKSLLKRFLDAKLEKNGFHAVYAENGIKIDGKARNDEDKIYSRIGHYLQNGTVTHGGIKIYFYDREKNRWRDLTEAEILQKVREKIVELDAEFNIWLKTDYEFLDKIRQKAKDPKNLYFEKTDDESALSINGANSDIKLHGYQNAFVRKMAREFSGINAFGVGLGKTFTGIATAQYALETGTKKKICFVLPNSVMSNWNKEVRKYLKDNEKDRCLFVGGDIDRNGDFVVNSKNYARDLNVILENKHNKIFITQQAFEKIRLREESVKDYLFYLGRVDKSFAESQNASKNEKAAAKKENLAAEIAGKNKLENAPYFEDLGIDAVIVDEAHHFKNAKTALKMTRIKGLPSSTKSARAIDINVKTWLIRNNNPRKDGVLLLTATPVTNSPIEIYSMMSLALGEERVNNSMLGAINSPDEFLESICDIQNREEWNIQNDVLSVSSLVGIKNLELLKNLIHNNSDIKNAKDVGASFKQVDSEDISDGVVLDSATRVYLDK
ncbi:MAG: DEAD/DEAH box helicase family protein, partial [Neisseriaceae bacterium]|nr:DEAD/DEAH box helicase family protein [Neisseriaceae bacterium]